MTRGCLMPLLSACPHAGVLFRTENSWKYSANSIRNGMTQVNEYQWMLDGKHLRLKKVTNRLSSYKGEVVYTAGVQI